MKTAKNLIESDGYFESLPEKTREIIKDAILQAADDRSGPEGWKTDEESLNDIECHRRDGFIPFSHNLGGLIYQNFTDLMGYFGGGYTPAHKGAAKEIERQIDYSFECLSEETFNKFKDLLESKGLTQSDCNYHAIHELDDESLREVERYIEDGDHEVLGGENASIMHEIRFMYHGLDEDGNHTASVSAAVNTEGPYHRSSIPWASSVFCEGAKELEIKWKTNAALKVRLGEALKEVSKAVF